MIFSTSVRSAGQRRKLSAAAAKRLGGEARSMADAESIAGTVNQPGEQTTAIRFEGQPAGSDHFGQSSFPCHRPSRQRGSLVAAGQNRVKKCAIHAGYRTYNFISASILAAQMTSFSERPPTLCVL